MKKHMKKLLVPTMLVLSVSLMATGCTDDTNKKEDININVNDEDTKDSADDIIKDTEDDVRDVNYEDIKVTPEEAFDKFMELHADTKVKEVDLDKGLMDYQYVIKGYDDENDYEVKINPVDGQVISDDSDVVSLDDDNIEITKDHLAKIDGIIEKAKKEDGSDSELDEWNISSEYSKPVMYVEIGLIKYYYDIETGELTKNEEVEKDNDNDKDNDSNAFTDIEDQNEETQKAIKNVTSKGMMIEKGKSEFKPDELMTREDVAVAMVNGFYEVDENAKVSFTDVKEDDEFYKHIATSEKEDIVNGYPNEEFKGSENITKQGFISIVSRALHEKKESAYPDNAEETIKFEDKDKIANYAIKELSLAVNEELIDNTEEKLEPEGTVTRAEAAVILNRLIEKLK